MDHRQGSSSSDGLSDVLTHDRMAELKEAFSLFDPNGTGFISRDELRVLLLALTPEFSEEELAHILELADVDGNGTIDFAEFVSLMVDASAVGSVGAGSQQEDVARIAAASASPSRAREMVDLFSKFDSANSGFVNKEHFLKVLQSGDDALSEMEASEVWDDAIKMHCVKRDLVHYKKFVTKLVAAERRSLK